jgi:hypothetical protein
MHIVLTSINAPNVPLRIIADGAKKAGFQFTVIGDTKSPSDFSLDGCRFIDVEAQIKTGLAFAQSCPTRHYARKNIGYLLAIAEGAPQILETDDDNIPRPEFFGARNRHVNVRTLSEARWINVYRYFSEVQIWPRGLPLEFVQQPVPDFDKLAIKHVDCPIQQGLADENPDVDAVYRLLMPLPQSFRSDRRIALGRGAWCPFNSQNTTWWPEAYPLLYLPAYCSFRMTDIWRSFVAQRIAWENDWHVLFHEPTVYQERNEHSLIKDFADEVPGYLNNDRIRKTLEDLELRKGSQHILDNLAACYESLAKLEVIGKEELPLLTAWMSDLNNIREGRSGTR